MDYNGDGSITRSELRRIMTGLRKDLTDAMIDEMIRVADTNNDDKIQFGEFVKASTKRTLKQDKEKEILDKNTSERFGGKYKSPEEDWQNRAKANEQEKKDDCYDVFIARDPDFELNM